MFEVVTPRRCSIGYRDGPDGCRTVGGGLPAIGNPFTKPLCPYPYVNPVHSVRLPVRGGSGTLRDTRSSGSIAAIGAATRGPCQRRDCWQIKIRRARVSDRERVTLFQLSQSLAPVRGVFSRSLRRSTANHQPYRPKSEGSLRTEAPISLGGFDPSRSATP